MKRLLNWLLCHNVILVVALFIVAAVYWRVSLFDLKTESQLAPVNESVSSTPAVAAAVTPAGQIEPATMPEAESEAEAKPEPEAKLKSETEVVATSPETVAVEQSPTEPSAAESDASGVVTFPEEAKDKPEKIMQQNDYQFRPQDMQAAEDAVDEDLLQKARQAYWNDDLTKSRSLYNAYIELNPENPDGYGELGNLLSTLGDLDSAAQMYNRAAELLIKQGKPEQASKLLDVLDSIEVIQKAAE